MKNNVIIGVSGSQMIDQSGIFPGYRRAYVNQDYMRSIAQSGGIPIILPILDEEKDIEPFVKVWVDSIDGLILSGGHDICPNFYGEEPRQKLGEIWPERDKNDLLLLKYAIDKQIPVLGICRGFQLINAFFGAKIGQDLSYSENELIKHSQGHRPDLPTHRIKLNGKGVFFNKILAETTMVNSFHHQFVKDEVEELLVVARSSDGIIEAVEHKNLPIYAVQWHPEMLSRESIEAKKIFEEFIKMCL